MYLETIHHVRWLKTSIIWTQIKIQFKTSLLLHKLQINDKHSLKDTVTYWPGQPFVISMLQFSPWWPWWRHQMDIFSALLYLWVGNSPITGEFPSQRPMTRSFDVFFDLRLNKRLIKQPRYRWSERPSRSLWSNASHIGTRTNVLTNKQLSFLSAQILKKNQITSTLNLM